MIAAVTLFTVMTALIKAASRVPPGEAVFFRAFLTVPAMLVWFGAQGRIAEALGTRNWKGHAWRGMVGTAAMSLGFVGLRFLPLPEVTALQFVTPIIIVLLAAVMLGETVRLIRLSAVAVGLLGVVVILWPRLSVQGSSQELIGAACVLTSALCAAFAQIFVKRMTGTENTTAIVFYFAVTASILGLMTAPFGWVWPDGPEWLFLLGAGITGLSGQLMITRSYTHADASILAPFTYVSMLWSILIGWLAFSEVPTPPMLAGSALIIAAGLAIYLRERQLGKRQATEGKVRAKSWQ